jgi:hypothetical protein
VFRIYRTLNTIQVHFKNVITEIWFIVVLQQSSKLNIIGTGSGKRFCFILWYDHGIFMLSYLVLTDKQQLRYITGRRAEVGVEWHQVRHDHGDTATHRHELFRRRGFLRPWGSLPHGSYHRAVQEPSHDIICKIYLPMNYGAFSK